jgi:hypothetical protein
VTQFEAKDENEDFLSPNKPSDTLAVIENKDQAIMMLSPS